MIPGDPPPLEPLPYHVEIIRYLQTHEADLWNWFAADRLRAQQNEAVRLDLLKATYRIERDANPALYAAADEVAGKLGLTSPVIPAAPPAVPQAPPPGGDGPATANESIPITIYQSQSAGGLNVSLAYMPGEAHLVLTGPVTTTLNPTELRGVLAHELSHFALLDRWRDYLIASQLLAAMTNDPQATISHLCSARLFGLYGEVYCDRGSLMATGDLAATITALVKIATGLTDVSADSYLRQADEIFAKGHPRAEGVTHPEMFIRAKALALWADRPQEAAGQIGPVIEGPLALAELDLLGQQQVSQRTRRLIERFLRPAWIQTEPTLAHARLFFDDFKADDPSAPSDAALADDLKTDDEKLRDYFCYVLLDFAVVDRDLEDAPLAAGLLLADELGFGDRFRQLAAKELNLRKKQLETLEAEASSIVAKAAEEEVAD